MGYARDVINDIVDKASFRVSFNPLTTHMRIGNHTYFLPVSTVYLEAPKYIGMLCSHGLRITDPHFFPKPPGEGERKCLFYYLDFGASDRKEKEPVALVEEEGLEALDSLDILLSPFLSAMDRLDPMIRVVKEKDIEWLQRERTVWDAYPIQPESNVAMTARLFQALFQREYRMNSAVSPETNDN